MRKQRTVWPTLAALVALVACRLTFGQVEPPPSGGNQTDAQQREQAPDQEQAKPKADQQADQPPKRTLDLSNPRATMRAFLLAIQDADGEHPERIDDAVQCLDTSSLEAEGDERVKAVRALARRLHALIEKRGVKLEDISEDPQGTPYLFHRLEPEAGVGPTPEIGLKRDPDTERWLFTADTLAFIPALEQAVAKEAQAEAAKPVESTVPPGRSSPRATVTTFLEAMNADPPNWDEAVLCLDPTGRDPNVWEVRGQELATKLKNVMDKIEEVVLSEIQVAVGETQYRWYESGTGNIVIGVVQEEWTGAADWKFAPQKGEWRVTLQTLKTLDALYDEFENKQIVQELQEAGVQEELTFGLRLRRLMPDWLRTKFVGLEGWKWLILVALLPLGWLVLAIASAIVGLLLGRWLRHRRLEIDDDALRRVVRSCGAVAMVLVWYYAVQILGLPDDWLAVLLPGAKLALAVTCVWVAYRAVDIVGGHIAANKDIRLTRFDDVLIPLLRGILRVLVVVVGFLMVADWMAWKLGPVLGALGIGGVAIAFAAQDTIGNFFGSITVLLDRPFGIGDWIVLGDVEGTVERVGFRSTRVRTFYNSVFTIPNSKMVNTQVDNFGARRFRRIKVMLSVTYDTPPEKVDAFCEGIRELIRLHPYTRKDYYHVYFNQFAASSLDILLYCFLETPEWSTELRERHRLFIDILRLAKRLGVAFAFPTQTLWLQRTRAEEGPSEGIPIAPGQADPEAVGFDEAARLFEEVHGPTPSRPAPVVIDRAPRSKRKRPDDGRDSKTS